MLLPTFGVALLTVLTMAKSVEITLIVSVKSLPASVGSCSTLIALVVLFVMVLPACPTLTVPDKVRVAEAPESRLNPFHTPVTVL